MGRTETLRRSVQSELVARAVQLASTGILLVLLARILDPDAYGLVFLTMSICGVARIISGLGLGKSAARYINEYRINSPAKVPGIAQWALVCNLLLILCVCSVVYIARYQIAELLNEPDLAPLLLVGSILLGATSVMAFFRKILPGFEAVDLSAAVAISSDGSRVILVPTLAFLGGAVGALVGYLIATLVSIAVGATYLRSLLRDFDRDPIGSSLKRQVVEYAAPLAVTQGADILDRHLDTILIGFFLSPVFVAYYSVAKQIVMAIERPAIAAGFAISPTIGADAASGASDDAARLYTTILEKILIIYPPACLGLILVADPTIRYIFGSDYLGAVPVLQVLAIYGFLQAVTYSTMWSLDFLGRAKSVAYVKIVASSGNIVLTVLLIPLIGVVGAALATVVTHTVYVIANLWIINSELALHWRSLTQTIAKSAIAAALMAVVVTSATMYVEGIVTLIGVISLGGIVWALVSFSLGMFSFSDIKQLSKIGH